MQSAIGRAGLWTMLVLAVGVAIYSFRFAAVPAHIWFGIDPGIRGVIERVPFQALGHMIVAPIALLVGPFQFVTAIRARRPALHRTMGKIYVAACLIAGASALAVLWITTTFGAWRAAVQRKFALHQLLMKFSYAMTFGAVTLRLQIPFFMMDGFPSYSAASVWLAYTSWIPNVIVVALWEMAKALRAPRAVAA